MPRHNEPLKVLLVDDSLNSKKGAIAALDAILAAGYGDPEGQKKFRQAIVTHKAFWDDLLQPLGNQFKLNFQIPANPKLDDDTFLCESGAQWNPDVSPHEETNFASLTSLALVKRAELSLKEADASQLEAIIRQSPDDEKALRSLLVNDNDGTTKFGSPTVTIPNWVQSKKADLDKHQIANLKIAAKRQLLILKLKDCTDKALIDKLLANQKNAGVFKEQVIKLFGNQGNNSQIANGIELNPVFNEAVKHAAAKRSVSLHLSGDAFKKPQVLNLLKAEDTGKFRQALDALGVKATTLQALPENDKDFMDSVKKDVGARFLIAKAAELKEADFKHLVDVAVADEPSVAKSILKRVNELEGVGDETYIDLAVTANSLPQIREACAVNALKISISKCSDPATLDALLTVSSVATLKTVLTEKVSLGFADKTKFHEAFKENTAAFNSIVAAAHLRKNIALSNNLVLLKELIISPPNQFKQHYFEKFTIATGVKTAISKHFDIEENVKAARRQALLAYVKAKLPEQSENDLRDLAEAKGIEDVREKVRYLLGGDQANNLLADGDEESTKLAIEIHFNAAVELVILRAKADKDLSKTTAQGNKAHDELLADINGFTLKVANDAQFLVTDKVKNNLITHLAQSLIRNFPQNRVDDQDTGNILVKLAKEKDLVAFKHLLTDKFGVENTAWVNKESMEQLQKTACIREIELSQNLIFGNKTHPQLFKLIENLRQEKRLALMAKPEVLRDLTAATDKHEIERILGGVRVVSDELINGLVEENIKINLFAKIVNYEVAATLARLKPPIDIKLAQVNAINERLNDETDNLFKTKNNSKVYELTIQQGIAALIKPYSNVPALYTAFGLEDGRLAQNLRDDQKDKINEIRKQQNHNAALRSIYNGQGTPPTDMILIESLLSFRKKQDFADFSKFNTHFNSSNSIAKFHENTEGESFLDAFDPPLTQQLTPQMFEEMKIRARSNALDSTTEEAVEASVLARKDLQKKQSRVQLDSDAKESLMRLSRASLMHSFNPAFQATALKNAKKMALVIRDLSKNCASYITYYDNLKREAYQNAIAIDDVYQKAKVEGNSAKREQLFKARNKWVIKYKEIESEYNALRGLQTIFVGDPDSANPAIQKGMLKMLEEAEAGSRDFKINPSFGITTYSTPYLLSDRARHFTNAYTGADNPNPTPGGDGATTLVTNAGTEQTPYEIVDAIPTDHFREHTVVVGQEKGLYMEERTSQHLVTETNAAGEPDYKASKVYTAIKVPNSTEGKVALAMTMAMQAVGDLKEPPTAKNPIAIEGLNDPEFARYLWTALMAIGDSDPNFKFGKDAIQMNAARVDIDKEFGYFGRWSNESIYNTVFKNSANYKNMLEPIKALNEKRFGDNEKKEFKEIVEDSTKLRDFFKPKLEKPKVKKELDEVEANRPTLGPKTN